MLICSPPLRKNIVSKIPSYFVAKKTKVQRISKRKKHEPEAKKGGAAGNGRVIEG